MSRLTGTVFTEVENMAAAKTSRQPFAIVCLAGETRSGTGGPKLRAQRVPGRIHPAADGRKNGETHSEDDAQQGGVFDEGRAVVIGMESTEERNNRFHFLQSLIEFTYAVLVDIQKAIERNPLGRPHFPQ